MRDGAVLDQLFAKYAVVAVLHFAALKAVGESVQEPMLYYSNNVKGTLTLCQAMTQAVEYLRWCLARQPRCMANPPPCPLAKRAPWDNPPTPTAAAS